MDSLSEKLRLKVGIPRINQIDQIDPFKIGRFRNCKMGAYSKSPNLVAVFSNYGVSTQSFKQRHRVGIHNEGYVAAHSYKEKKSFCIQIFLAKHICFLKPLFVRLISHHANSLNIT